MGVRWWEVCASASVCECACVCVRVCSIPTFTIGESSIARHTLVAVNSTESLFTLTLSLYVAVLIV